MSQKEAILSDPYLKHLYYQKASEFVKENNIGGIIDNFVGEVIYGTTFSQISELYTFEFLHFSTYAFSPVYEFSFLKEKITKGLVKKLLSIQWFL